MRRAPGDGVLRALRTPLTVWLVGLLAYLVAVFHRSSLAVAGLAASERFDITAAQLATFTTLQLVVYVAMQVPVGLLVDRFGSRTMLTVGAILMAVGQVVFALAAAYPVAVAARVLTGVGDAMTFICVLRLVNSWFPVRRIPVVTQLTGTLGQFGAVLAAVPMTWALAELGWSVAYLIAAAAGLVLTAAILLVLHDTPTHRHLRGSMLSVADARSSLAASWAHPGTRLGFWMHFSTQFSATTLSLLWGYPFLVKGEQQSPAAAGLLLTLMVLAVMAAGPALGWLVSNHPWHRSTMVLTIVLAIAGVWTGVLAWPGPAPLPLLVLLMVVVGIGAPASMIGFDVGRTSNPGERFASASGIINQGGFLASLILVTAVGVVLDWRTSGSGTDYTPSAFQWAMATQYALWLVGGIQIYRYRRRLRRVTNRAELEAMTRRPPRDA